MDPRGGVFGHSAYFPRLQGLEQCGLDHFLDELEVPPAEESRQHRDQAPRLAAEEMLDERGDWIGLLVRHDANRRRETSLPRHQSGQGPYLDRAAGEQVR